MDTSATTAGGPGPTRVPTFCALCVSRCGAIAVVEDGRFVALEPDPSHPTGKALCAKGRAAPELVEHPDRLTHPLRRTRPKGDPDPGWERMDWDEALALTASSLRRIAGEYGPESVAFGMASPSTSASSDALVWIERLMRAFGSPSLLSAMELCGWGRYGATTYTFGTPAPGAYMPDLERAGCILFWGYNPNLARLSHGVATAEALKRGARLVVVDPRRVGPAAKADEWLRVRPGTDGALALGLAHVMIQEGWYDADFIRRWTNGPFLVHGRTGRLVREGDLSQRGSPDRYVAWDERAGAPVAFDPARGAFVPLSPDGDPATAEPHPALFGEFQLDTVGGRVTCTPVFQRMAAGCARCGPAEVERICGVGPEQLRAAAALLWKARPVAYYAWSGVEMQTGSTQIARAIAQLYALTGSLDTPGGNVLFASVPTAELTGQDLLAPDQRARTLGLAERPLGPGRWQHVATDDLYRAALQGEPYPVRGLVAFGTNLLLSHCDGRRGREALTALDFYVHADLFMNPTAELADVVLPVAGAFEREGLKVGFEISQEAQSLVQLRPPVVPPPGEARSDMEIVFGLATRLGLGEHFWDGDVDAAYRALLAPSGVALEALRAEPAGVRVPLRTRHRKFAELEEGIPRGFPTPSRRIELYSERFLEAGQPPLPDYEPPLVAPEARPDLAHRFPLRLTCAKHTLFCESQHRGLPSLRRRAPDPEVELHPRAAAERSIAPGDWVRIDTPAGSVRARARLNDSLAADVVCGQHGWWQACEAVGAPGYDPFGPEGANFNLLIANDQVDPVSGSVPHRAYLCQVRPDRED